MEKWISFTQKALEPVWPVPYERLTAFSDALRFGSPEEGGILFAYVSDQDACVPLLVVDPEKRKRGIGSGLLRQAEAAFSARGVKTVSLARGQGQLWQGVPEGAEGFFQKNGYTPLDTSWDMTMDLRQYQHTRLLPEGVSCRLATSGDWAEVNQLMNAPDLVGWKPIYEERMRKSPETVLLAETERKIAGFVILEKGGQLWEACFPGPVGGFGCIGVGESYRSRSIGLSLAAEATRRLRDDLRIVTSYVAWTWLIGWYGQIGYTPWRKFTAFRKTLPT